MAKAGRGFIRVYRTYQFIDKDPIIDKVRTLLQDEGLIKNLGVAAEISGVARATLDNWFSGDTKKPQHYTIAAVVTSLGYEEAFVKKKDINIEKERAAAAAWLEKQGRKLAAHKTPSKRKP